MMKKNVWIINPKYLEKWGLWITWTNGEQGWATQSDANGVLEKSPLIGATVFTDDKDKLLAMAEHALKFQWVLSAVPKKITLPVPESSDPPEERKGLYRRPISGSVLGEKDIDKLLDSLSEKIE